MFKNVYFVAIEISVANKKVISSIKRHDSFSAYKRPEKEADKVNGQVAKALKYERVILNIDGQT
jgi:hypothetical protein